MATERNDRNVNNKRKFSSKKKRDYRKKGASAIDAADSSKCGGFGATDSDMQSRSANDPRWYAMSEQLLKDAASFPYSWPLGYREDLNVNGTLKMRCMDTDKEPNAIRSVPGLMSIYLSPAVGVSSTQNSPVNVASRSVYTFVRKANSGAKNYEHQDLMMYLLAMDSCYSFHAFLKRLYGVMMDYTPYNRYLPKALVASMNVDFDDIEANLAGLRAYINQFAVKLGSMCIPNTMSYMVRHMWMYSNIYTDSQSPKAQNYIFNPQAFYRFEIPAEGGPGQLTYTPWATLTDTHTDSGKPGLKTIQDYGNALINAVLGDEDMNIMSGDILKAYEMSGIVRLGLIDESYQVVPVYSAEVLSQIQNATLMGYYQTGDADNNITQRVGINDGYILAQPSCVMNMAGASFREGAPNPETLLSWVGAYADAKIITINKTDVTPADTMVATRLANCVGVVEQVGASYPYLKMTGSCGSEIAHAAIIYYFDGGELKSSKPIFTQNWVWSFALSEQYNQPDVDVSTIKSALPTMLGSVVDAVRLMALLSQFDYHPMVYVSVGQVIARNPIEVNDIVNGRIDGAICVHGSEVAFFGDIDMYTRIGLTQLENLHQTALMSEFSVPILGTKLTTK